MSTPLHKKEARRRLHQAQKEAREYEELFGKVTKTKRSKKEFKPYEPAKAFHRETVRYPSRAESSVGNATKKETPKYSGEYLVGIATMHKSNLVPVGREDNPVNYSTMRRN